MAEPQHKRVKLPGGGGKLLGVSDELPSSELQLLHHQLCSKCLCSLQLQQILNTFNRCNLYFSGPAHYQIAQGIEGSLVYASLLTLFFEVALKQQSRGLVCTRISEVVMAGADNESDITSILFEFLAQDNRYVSYSAMRALVSLLLLLRGPLAELLICRFIDIMLHSNNWLQLGHSFEAVRRVIEWKDVEEHPLEAGEDAGPPAQCKLMKLSLTDIYGSNGVKYRATKILDYNWDALVSRSLVLLEVHTLQREHVFVSFVSLWTALISVKNNLNFGSIKKFYRGLEKLVNPLLKHSTPLVIWEKILDLFNEVLCYGSTLALQEVLAEEPCQLAALLVSAVRSRHLLEFVPCGQPAEDVYQTHTDQNRTAQLQGDFRQTQVRTRLQTHEQLGHYSGLQLVQQPSNSQAVSTVGMESNQWNLHHRIQPNDQSNTLVGCHGDREHTMNSLSQTRHQKDPQPDHRLAPAGPHSGPQSSSWTDHHCLDPDGGHCYSDANAAQRLEGVCTVARPGMHNDGSLSLSPENSFQRLLTLAGHHSNMQTQCNNISNRFVIQNDLDCTSVTQEFQHLRKEKNEGNMCCADQEVICPQGPFQHESQHKEQGLGSTINSFHSSLISKESIFKFDNCADDQLDARTEKLADQVKKQISNLHIDRCVEIGTRTHIKEVATSKGSAEMNAVSACGLQSSSCHLPNVTMNNRDMSNYANQIASFSFTFPSDGEREYPQNFTNQSQGNNNNKETFMPNRFESVLGTREANYYTSAPLVSARLPPPSNDSVQGSPLQLSPPEAACLPDTQNGSPELIAGGSPVREACSSHGLSDAATVAPSHLEQSINGLQILQNCYGHQEDGSDSDEAATIEGEVVSGVSRGWQPWAVSASDNYVAGQCSNSIRTSFNNLSVNNAFSSDRCAKVSTSSSNADVSLNQNSDEALMNRTFYFTPNDLCDSLCASTSKGKELVNNNSEMLKSTEQPILFDGRGVLSKSCTNPKSKMEKHSSCAQFLPIMNKLTENKLPGAPFRMLRTVSPGAPGTSSNTYCKSSSKSLSDDSDMEVNASGIKPDLGNSLIGNDSEMSSSSEGEAGDGSILKDSEQHLRVVVFRKAVLMVLKAIAVTVKEARGDGGSSSSSSENSSPRSRGDSETEEMDMEIIRKSLKDVLVKVDEFVKRRECYHPHCLVAEWLVKLFSAQDDWMVEAMVCGLDIYSGLGHSVSGVGAQVAAWLCPHTSFLVFIDTVRYDYSVLLDLLVSNETCFLLYLLRYLKVTKRSWSSLQSVATVDGANMNLAMETMQQLRDSINKLVAKELFPYDITPVLRLLDHCLQLFSAVT